MELKGIDEKTVVHCSTIDLARTCLEIAKKVGIEWASGESLNKTNWNKYKKTTCYNFSVGTVGHIEYYKSQGGYKIIPAEEFIALNREVTDRPTISPENAKVQDLNETLEVLRVLSTVLTAMDSDETMKKVSDLKMKYLGKL